MGDYDELTVEELKDELANRELPVSGNKAELVERLEEDDGESGEEEPTEGEVTTSTEGIEDVVSQALGLEEPLKAAADSVMSGPNSDALKSALRNASQGIGHIRKVLDMNVRLS